MLKTVGFDSDAFCLVYMEIDMWAGIRFSNM